MRQGDEESRPIAARDGEAGWIWQVTNPAARTPRGGGRERPPGVRTSGWRRTEKSSPL